MRPRLLILVMLGIAGLGSMTSSTNAQCGPNGCVVRGFSPRAFAVPTVQYPAYYGAAYGDGSGCDCGCGCENCNCGMAVASGNVQASGGTVMYGRTVVRPRLFAFRPFARRRAAFGSGGGVGFRMRSVTVGSVPGGYSTYSFGPAVGYQMGYGSTGGYSANYGSTGSYSMGYGSTGNYKAGYGSTGGGVAPGPVKPDDGGGSEFDKAPPKLPEATAPKAEIDDSASRNHDSVKEKNVEHFAVRLRSELPEPPTHFAAGWLGDLYAQK